MKPPEYSEPGPFVALHEEWVGAYPDPRDPAIEQRLRETYRDAWASDKAYERVYVLHFMHDAKCFEGADLLVDGVASQDYRVARLSADLLGAWHCVHDVEFGVDLRQLFVALLTRFPGLDLARWSAFCKGDGKLDWPASRTFIREYEEWVSQEVPRDEEVERDLLSKCRDVWRDGDYIDRAFVLNFLQVGHDDYAPDLIIEGLKSEEAGLAHTAIFSADCAIRAGVDLGPDTKDVIEAYVARFPENWVSAEIVWIDLGWRDGWLTRPPDDDDEE